MKAFITLVIALFFTIAYAYDAAPTESASAAEELAIYNQIMAELYDPGGCQQFVKPPFMACCNDGRRMMMEDYVSCCNESDVPEKYRVYCQRCINLGELDSLEFVMEVRDSLYALEWEDPRPYLLEKLDSTLGFTGFIKRVEEVKPSLVLQASALQQTIDQLTAITGSSEERRYGKAPIAAKQVKFVTAPPRKSKKEKMKPGKNEGTLLLGSASFSRIYFNQEGDKGILQFGYLGRADCGEVNYVLIQKEKEQWKVVQKILYGAF
jgi:hypothetical protein